MSALTPFLNQMLHGDCLSLLPHLPAESVDLVVTDPPYLVNYRARDGRTVPGDTTADWLAPAFAELYRVLRPIPRLATSCSIPSPVPVRPPWPRGNWCAPLSPSRRMSPTIRTRRNACTVFHDRRA